MKPHIEDYPPLQISWKFRLKRWVMASEIPLALALVGCMFIAGSCFLAVFFMVTP